MAFANKWQHVMFAQRVQLNIFDDDHFIGIRFENRAVDYFFAGHTHGGQVDLPLLGRLIVPSEFGDRYAAGPLVGERLRGFVSSGIGTSIIPVRFRVPPEISIVSLH